MPHALNKLTIKGFKSIQSLEDFELTNLNVLIGGNGAGKSNLIDFFRMLRAMMELPLPGLPIGNLKAYLNFFGGIDNLLFNGPKMTKQIEVELFFGNYGYRFVLIPTADKTCLIKDEAYYNGNDSTDWKSWGSGHTSPELIKAYKSHDSFLKPAAVMQCYRSIRSQMIYHFNDTSYLASMRRSESIDDNSYLREDASNIAPVLFRIKNEDAILYQKILEIIRLVAPFFDEFVFKPDDHENIWLLWKQKGSDIQLKPYHLSDGTIRFIGLVTALMQPESPSTIIIDEPELGLHPQAIDIIAGLINEVSFQSQIIISTQSSALLDYFEPEEIIVVERNNGASNFERLDKQALSLWLKKYKLSQLWYTNALSGSPIYVEYQS